MPAMHPIHVIPLKTIMVRLKSNALSAESEI